MKSHFLHCLSLSAALQRSGDSVLQGQDRTGSLEQLMGSLTDLKYVGTRRMKIRDRKITSACVSFQVRVTGTVFNA